MLTNGSTAPDLTLHDTAGGPLRLNDLRGQPVLLYLMRAAGCALCNAHVRDLVSRKADLDAAGVRVIVVLPESREDAAAWKAARKVPFTAAVGGAAGGAAHEGLGFARRLLGSMQQSGTVLLDAGGVVRHTRVSTMPTGSYDKSGLLAAIAQLAPAPGAPVDARTPA